MDIFAISTGAFALSTVAATAKWVLAHVALDTEKYTVELLHEDIAEMKAKTQRRDAAKLDVVDALEEISRDQAHRIQDLIAENFKLSAEKRRRDAPLKAGNAKRKADAAALRRARMEAADQRLAMKEAAE